MTNAPTISLCLIVKNEEKMLRDFFASSLSFCDEIIVVDTGSTDQTKNIAQQAGAKVFSFEWCDDFSKARNYSLSLATSDWILVLDADERITSDDAIIIRQSVSNAKRDCFDLCQVNYVNQNHVYGFIPNTLKAKGFESYLGYTGSWLTRLFRRDKNFQFVGRVHEHLACRGKVIDGERLEVHLHHYGQVLNPEKLLEKKRKYCAIGREKVAEDPDNFKGNQELGIAYWELGELAQAETFLQKAYQLNGKSISNLMGLGTVKMLLKKSDEAESYLQKACEINPCDSQAHWALGNLYFLNGDYAKAILAFKKQIEVNPDSILAHQRLYEAYLAKHDEPTISACYIVKNEADCLEKSLLSIKDHVEEIIVVDTGSSDDTMAVARKMGAKVFQISWQNDFSWARNQSLKQATSEWILILDADEVIGAQDWTEIKALMKSGLSELYSLVQTTYSDKSAILNWKANDIQDPESKGYHGYFESSLVRLFKNNPKIKFFGSVHEHAYHDDKSIGSINSKIRIHHYGKQRSTEKMKSKSDLYYEIGKKKMAEMPQEPHAYYEMAVQLWDMERVTEAEPYFLKALELEPKHELALVGYASFLHQQKRYADSLDYFVKSLSINPNNIESYIYTSSVLIDVKKYDMAMVMIEEAKKRGASHNVALILNEGVVFLQWDRFAEAKSIFLKARDINPKSGAVYLNLAIVCMKLKEWAEAESSLRQALALQNTDFLAHKLLGEVLFQFGKKEEALREFCNAHCLDPHSNEAVAQVIISALSLGQNELAKEYEEKFVRLKYTPNYANVCTKLVQFYGVRKDGEGMTRLINSIQS